MSVVEPPPISVSSQLTNVSVDDPTGVMLAGGTGVHRFGVQCLVTFVKLLKMLTEPFPVTTPLKLETMAPVRLVIVFDPRLAKARVERMSATYIPPVRVWVAAFQFPSGACTSKVPILAASSPLLMNWENS